MSKKGGNFPLSPHKGSARCPRPAALGLCAPSGGLLLAVLVILVDAGAPVLLDLAAPADAADHIAQHLVVQGGAGFVAAVVGGAVRGDAEAPGLRRGVDVGAQEEEFPAVLRLFVFDHFADLGVVVAAAGVLHAVGGDDEEGLVRHVLPPGVFVDVADVVDGAAHRIQERGAAAHEVLLLGQRRDFVQGQPVVDDLALVVKEHRGDEGFPGLPPLLFDQRVEAADGVRLQPCHGSAPV